MKKQSLELQHIDIFYEKGAILFHDLLSTQKVKEARHPLCLISQPSLRNVWQHAQAIKKLSFNQALSHLASQLVRLKMLRFGFDHYFSSFQEVKNFFKPDLSLSEISSFDGLEIAVLINLSSATEPTDPSECTFPVLSASGCFFNPNLPLDFSSIESADGPFFLITYCKGNARYIFQPLDPFTHDSKKEGCGFGDVVSNQFHPLLHH